MQIGKWVFDRMEVSFHIFKQIPYSTLLFIIGFNICFVVIIPAIFFAIFSMIVWVDALTTFSAETSLAFSLGTSLILLYVISYLTLLVLSQLVLYISVKNTLYKTPENFMENLKIAYWKIWNVFKVYWYIFAYVYLLPASIFIAGGLTYIWYLITRIEVLNYIAITCIVISVILAIVFSIYRWLQTSFSLLYSIDKDNYQKQNFVESLWLSQNKLLRIFWNLLLVWLIAWLIIGLFEWVLDSFIFSTTNLWVLTELENPDINWTETLKSFTDFSWMQFLSNLIWNIISSIFMIYLVIFTYIFMKRLEFENWQENKTPQIKHENKEVNIITEEF